jgi:hypothetical protein
LDGAVVVVEGATLATLVAGPITVIIIGVLLNVVGLGVFCWALFALAIQALPFFIGMTAGIYTYQTRAGPLGAVAIAFAADGFALVLGQYALSVARPPIVRRLIRLLFAIPAARAGHDVTLAIAQFGIPQGWWRESFAMLGAIAVGCTAWARVSILTEPALRPGVAFGPAQLPIGRRPTAGDSAGLSSVGWDQRRCRFVQHDRDIAVLSNTGSGNLVWRR